MFRLFAGLGTGLDPPIENALFPDIYVPDDKRRDERQYFNESDRAVLDTGQTLLTHQALKGDREWNDKKDFDIEQEENNGDDVEFDRIFITSRADRVFAAFVGHEFRRRAFTRADKLRDQQLADAKAGRDQKHDRDGYVIENAIFRHFDLSLLFSTNRKMPLKWLAFPKSKDYLGSM